MTRDLFNKNVRTSTFLMYVKAILASFVVLVPLDLIMFSFLSEENRVWLQPSYEGGVEHALIALAMVFGKILFLVSVRGFVGHLKPWTACKNVFLFFLVLGAIVDGWGTVYGMPVVVAILSTLSGALGTGVSAYFLGSRAK